jgi:hypothetical protein
MTKRVLKYPVDTDLIPENHRFLHAGVQQPGYAMWLEADALCRKLIPNPYTLVPTGYAEVPEGAVHKITFIDANAGTVWHVYDKRGHVIFHNKGDSEATFVADGNDACFACGGSGHAGDAVKLLDNIYRKVVDWAGDDLDESQRISLREAMKNGLHLGGR